MATLARVFSEPVGVKKYFLLDFQKRGRSASESGVFFSDGFNRCRKRAVWKSSFYSLFLLTILGLHLHRLRKLFTHFPSILKIQNIHDNSEKSFPRALTFTSQTFEPHSNRILCVMHSYQIFPSSEQTTRHFFRSIQLWNTLTVLLPLHNRAWSSAGK